MSLLTERLNKSKSQSETSNVVSKHLEARERDQQYANSNFQSAIAAKLAAAEADPARNVHTYDAKSDTYGQR